MSYKKEIYQGEIKKMKIALTSCRENSQRLYRKELNMLGDKTVMEYTLDQMMELKDIFDSFILTTDWLELINKFKDSYPEIKFLERPKYLAEHDVPAQDYITYTLEPYHDEGNSYCLLQSTSPLRSIELIRKSHELFTQEYMSLFTVNKFTLHTDGQIYWFRDHEDIYQAPSYVLRCEPTVDLDYPFNLRTAEFILKGGFESENM